MRFRYEFYLRFCGVTVCAVRCAETEWLVVGSTLVHCQLLHEHGTTRHPCTAKGNEGEKMDSINSQCINNANNAIGSGPCPYSFNQMRQTPL
jgi:hypothetical protein